MLIQPSNIETCKTPMFSWHAGGRNGNSRRASASGAGSRRAGSVAGSLATTVKTSLINEVFKCPKDKHTKWSH